MRVGILQTNYLPWLGYFHLMNSVDVFVHYDTVQYDKHGWRNRNRIKNREGDFQWLSVPVLTKGLGAPILKEVKIDNTQKWQKQHLGSIRQFYGKSKHFEEFFPVVEKELGKQRVFLNDLNLELINLFSNLLGISTQVVMASDIKTEETEKNSKVIEITKKVGGTSYLSGQAAKDYIQPQMFTDAEVELQWHEFPHPEYPQLHGEFLSHLSILDALFNIGSQETRQLIF